MRRAFITGASGQDGHYLAGHLAASGRVVVGISRRPPLPPLGGGVDHRIADVTDHARVGALIAELAPDEIYHLAAYHRSSAVVTHVTEAEEQELYFRHNLEATRVLLRAAYEIVPHCRVFLAGSCHVFGDAEEFPQSERTPIRPNSLYGITKADNLWLGRYYREKLGFHCVTGILYNHESPLRGPSFVTGRIARAAAAIRRGQADELVLGDLEAQVDWGFAGDYARAMALMLEAPAPDDTIIASGALHRVRDFVEVAFAHLGLEWRKFVRQAPNVQRPVARAVYHGDVTALRALGWRPEVTFEDMVRQMVDAHLRS